MILFFFSTRGPSTPSTPLNSKKVKNEDDSSMDDLTKDLEEPVPEPNIQEVPVTKLGVFSFDFKFELSSLECNY